MTDLDPVRRAALIERYRAGHAAVVDALAGITDAELDARPAGDGEWTPREVVHHMADSEMTSAIRLRRLIAEGGRAKATSARHLLDRLTEAEWQRTGTHTESGAYGVGQWLEIYASHAHDHAEQIRRARDEAASRGGAG